MNTIDYFSQPDELSPRDRCTLHVILSPKNFGVSRALVRLSGCSRAELEEVFQNPPKSLQIERRRIKRLRRYLNSCGCYYQVSFSSRTYMSYENAAERSCILLPPLWCELALDEY